MAITDIDRLVFVRRTDNADLVPMTSPVNDIGANSTSTTLASITPGFAMRVDGVSYNSVDVSLHGYVRFAGTIASTSNANLFASSADVVIAPWWDSMRTAPTGGYVQHEVQGLAPFRQIVIEWYCALNGDSSTTDRRWAKFQCILFESKDKVEWRYGTPDVAGTPSGASGASMGIKGVTSVVTDNFRDLAVDNLELGGSKTTTTQNLNPATQWPSGTRIVFEPNWPMCGFYVDASDDEITGIQEPECDEHWRIANNVNWLYCNFRPPLVNLSPWAGQSAGTSGGPTVDDPVFIAPVSPSLDDGEDYIAYASAWSSDTTVNFRIDRDDDTDPQPSTDADWVALADDNETPDGDNIATWEFPVAILSSVSFLRFDFTGNDVKPMSIVIVPPARTDFDPTATFASGFVPMAIGQVRRMGAAIHPEFFNRAWKNIAYILIDRKQVVFSFGTSDDGDSAFDITSASFAVRTIGKAAASMLGWAAQSVTYQLIAKDSSDGGKVVFAEDGAASSTFTVDSNGGEYRYQLEETSLVSDAPTMVVTADPLGTMRIAYAGVMWTPNLVAEDYILGVTPPPRIAYLAALSARLRKACLYSYAMTGIATMLRLNSGDRWHCRWMIPPATKAMQPKIMRHDGEGKVADSALPTRIFADTSGSATDDEIFIPPAHATGRDRYPPDGGNILPITGALVFDAAPSERINRLLESPTAGTVTGPAIELVRILRGVGATLIPIPDDPSAS